MSTFLYASLLIGRLWTLYGVGEGVYNRCAVLTVNPQPMTLQQMFDLYEPLEESCRKLQAEIDAREAKYAYAACRIRKLSGKSLPTDVCEEPSVYETGTF